MKIVVINGTLSEAEQAAYIRHIEEAHPGEILEKVVFRVDGEYVDVESHFCRLRQLRKMGGCWIGEPATWNRAKQAECQASLTNEIPI